MAEDKRCDMCGFRDGKHGFRLRTCLSCGVSVHMECYGLIHDPNSGPDGFHCWACQAKGKDFETEGRNSDGSRLKIRQEERPRRCEFCSFENGIHAMHPLFDAPGKTGRQMHVKDPRPRLLWAHSICVAWLTDKGFYYGCCRTGEYDVREDDVDDDEVDDKRSVNPELAVRDNIDDIHHYVLNKESKYPIAELKGLKCIFCQQNDSSSSTLRFPVQCRQGEDDEYGQFADIWKSRTNHLELNNNMTCTQAFHIGCARWGSGRNSNIKHVYFYPSKYSDDPVTEAYCTLHATKVAAAIKPQKNTVIASSSMQNHHREHHRQGSGFGVARRGQYAGTAPAHMRAAAASAGPQAQAPVPRAQRPPTFDPERVQRTIAEARRNGTRIVTRRPSATQDQANPVSNIDLILADIQSTYLRLLIDENNEQGAIDYRKQKMKEWKLKLSSQIQGDAFKEFWNRQVRPRLNDNVEEERNRRAPQAENETAADEEQRLPGVASRASRPPEFQSISREDMDEESRNKKRKSKKKRKAETEVDAEDDGKPKAKKKKSGGSRKKKAKPNERNDHEVILPPSTVPPPPPPTSRWAYLGVSESWTGEEYEFEEWDTIEDVI